jgi:predicted deacylase
MTQDLIKSITYTGLEPGPKFFVLGAIHGNEKCGTIGINRVMDEIDSGTLLITHGQVTFVPIGNPRAYNEDKRYSERNLNRYLVPMLEPDCYEAKLGNILCPMLAACDVHLAIHSYTVGGEAFIFVAPKDKREHDLAMCLGPRTLLTGWEEAYAATGRKAKDAGDEESTGSIEYARRHGAIAVNIECGQHKDPAAPETAYQAIRNALRFLGMTNETKLDVVAEPTRLVTVTHVFYRDDAGKFPHPWKHLEAVKKDQPMAYRADGLAILAPEAGFIIMPKDSAEIGEEWFYLGVEKSAA